MYTLADLVFFTFYRQRRKSDVLGAAAGHSGDLIKGRTCVPPLQSGLFLMFRPCSLFRASHSLSPPIALGSGADSTSRQEGRWHKPRRSCKLGVLFPAVAVCLCRPTRGSNKGAHPWLYILPLQFVKFWPDK